MKTNDRKNGDEEATNANSRLAAMIPEKTKTEDDEGSVDGDDDAVGDARRSEVVRSVVGHFKEL